jgi:c-di-GMP-binding flagellar brake protein YcgR
VTLEEVELRLADVLDRLLSAAPRVPLTIPSRVEVVAEEQSKRVTCRTVNISSTGMLLDLPHAFRPGTVLAFELMLPGSRQPIRGRARVVRGTTQPSEPFRGVGVVFAAFEGSNEDRLVSYLERFAS